MNVLSVKKNENLAKKLIEKKRKEAYNYLVKGNHIYSDNPPTY
jgi:hypothetical protein